jgi:hypothetical protein
MDGAVIRYASVLCLIMAAWSSTAAAQTTPSLGDVARQEEARRGQTRKAARVFTNADLSSDPSAVAAAANNKEANASATAKPADAPAAVETATPALTPAKAEESEAVWRARAQRIQDTLDRARAAVAASSVPSPSENPREQELLAKLLDTAKKKLETAEQQWRLLEMQADVARVPKEWLVPKS